jgi:hypothetical protein
MSGSSPGDFLAGVHLYTFPILGINSWHSVRLLPKHEIYACDGFLIRLNRFLNSRFRSVQNFDRNQTGRWNRVLQKDDVHINLPQYLQVLVMQDAKYYTGIFSISSPDSELSMHGAHVIRVGYAVFLVNRHFLCPRN